MIKMQNKKSNSKTFIVQLQYLCFGLQIYENELYHCQGKITMLV